MKQPNVLDDNLGIAISWLGIAEFAQATSDSRP